MKKLIILLFVIIFIIGGLYSGVMVYLNSKGKDILLDSIKDNFGIEASVESVVFSFPFNVEIKKLSCGQDVYLDSMRLYVGGYNLFSSQMTLRKIMIDGLNIKITRQEKAITIDKVFVKDLPTADKTGVAEATSETQVKIEPKQSDIKDHEDKFAIEIKRIFINNSNIEFIDKTVGKEPKVFIFKKFSANMRNISYPELKKFFINLRSDLVVDGIEMPELIAIDGWVNYPKKDMNVNISLKEIDYPSFEVYYSPFFKSENLGVVAARLTLEMNLTSQKDNLLIDLLATLDNLTFKDSIIQQELDRITWLKTIITLIRGNNQKPRVRFKIKTKMTTPNFDFSQIQQQLGGMIKIDPFILLNQILGKAEKIVSTGISGTKEIAIDKTVEALKGTIKGISDIIKGAQESQEEPTPENKSQ